MKRPAVLPASNSKHFPIFWTLLVVAVVSGLMFVAAQTSGGQASGGVVSGGTVSGGAASGGVAQVPADPNAVVLTLGDTEITAAEFEPRFEIALRTLAAQQGTPLDEATMAQFGALRPNFLDQFATQQVLLQEAQARDISVPEAEVEAQITQARESAGENFEQALAEAGYGDEAALREYIGESLLLQRVVESVQGEVEVTDEAVRGFYDENTEQFAQPDQVCARHILVEDQTKADELYERLEGGADFAQVARNNSTDPGSKDNGGDLGCLTQGQTVPAFEEAAFAAEVGETTEPVQSDFGFHIIRVYEKNAGTTTPFAEVQEQVREQLVNEQLSAEIAELREASGLELFPENLPQTAPAVAPAPEGEGE